MLVTKPADLTLAIQKSTVVFTGTLYQPTDTDIIDIRQLLLPVLMKTKYDKLALTHNLYGFILPTHRYVHINSKGAYSLLLVITLYDDTIDRDATIAEVHRDKGKHKAKENDRDLYNSVSWW